MCLARERERGGEEVELPGRVVMAPRLGAAVLRRGPHLDVPSEGVSAGEEHVVERRSGGDVIAAFNPTASVIAITRTVVTTEVVDALAASSGTGANTRQRRNSLKSQQRGNDGGNMASSTKTRVVVSVFIDEYSIDTGSRLSTHRAPSPVRAMTYSPHEHRTALPTSPLSSTSTPSASTPSPRLSPPSALITTSHAHALICILENGCVVSYQPVQGGNGRVKRAVVLAEPGSIARANSRAARMFTEACKMQGVDAFVDYASPKLVVGSSRETCFCVAPHADTIVVVDAVPATTTTTTTTTTTMSRPRRVDGRRSAAPVTAIAAPSLCHKGTARNFGSATTLGTYVAVGQIDGTIRLIDERTETTACSTSIVGVTAQQQQQQQQQQKIPRHDQQLQRQTSTDARKERRKERDEKIDPLDSAVSQLAFSGDGSLLFASPMSFLASPTRGSFVAVYRVVAATMMAAPGPSEAGSSAGSSGSGAANLQLLQCFDTGLKLPLTSMVYSSRERSLLATSAHGVFSTGVRTTAKGDVAAPPDALRRFEDAKSCFESLVSGTRRRDLLLHPLGTSVAVISAGCNDSTSNTNAAGGSGADANARLNKNTASTSLRQKRPPSSKTGTLPLQMSSATTQEEGEEEEEEEGMTSTRRRARVAIAHVTLAKETLKAASCNRTLASPATLFTPIDGDPDAFVFGSTSPNVTILRNANEVATIDPRTETLVSRFTFYAEEGGDAPMRGSNATGLSFSSRRQVYIMTWNDSEAFVIFIGSTAGDGVFQRVSSGTAVDLCFCGQDDKYIVALCRDGSTPATQSSMTMRLDVYETKNVGLKKPRSSLDAGAYTDRLLFRRKNDAALTDDDVGVCVYGCPCDEAAVVLVTKAFIKLVRIDEKNDNDVKVGGAGGGALDSGDTTSSTATSALHFTVDKRFELDAGEEVMQVRWMQAPPVSSRKYGAFADTITDARYMGIVTDTRVMILDAISFTLVSSTITSDALSCCWLGYALLFTTPTHVRALLLNGRNAAGNDIVVGACYNASSKSTTTTLLDAFPDRVLLLGSVGSTFDCVHVQSMPMLEPMLLGTIAWHGGNEDRNAIRADALAVLRCVPFVRPASLSMLKFLCRNGLGPLAVAMMARFGPESGLGNLDRFHISLDADDMLSALSCLIAEFESSTGPGALFAGSSLLRSFERLHARCASIASASAPQSSTSAGPGFGTATEDSTTSATAADVAALCGRITSRFGGSGAVARSMMMATMTSDGGMDSILDDARKLCVDASVHRYARRKSSLSSTVAPTHEISLLGDFEDTGNTYGEWWTFRDDAVRYALASPSIEGDIGSAAGDFLARLSDGELRRDVATLGGRSRATLSMRSSVEATTASETRRPSSDWSPAGSSVRMPSAVEGGSPVSAGCDGRLQIDVGKEKAAPPTEWSPAIAAVADEEPEIDDDWDNFGKMLSGHGRNFGDSDSDDDGEPGSKASRSPSSSAWKDDDDDSDDDEEGGYVRRRLKMRIRSVNDVSNNVDSEASAEQLRKSAAMLSLPSFGDSSSSSLSFPTASSFTHPLSPPPVKSIVPPPPPLATGTSPKPPPPCATTENAVSMSPEFAPGIRPTVTTDVNDDDTNMMTSTEWTSF